MRIALVSRRYPPLIGGAEKVLSYLAAALAAEGAEVFVLTSRAPGTSAQEAGPNGSTIVRLPTSRLRFVGTWMYMRALDEWFSRNPIDIAYVSMLKHDAYVTLGAGEQQGFPVVLRPEGAGATGDIAWQRWGRFGRRIARRCHSADAVVAISTTIRAELIADGYDPDRIHDLPNGVPVPEEPWHSPAVRTGGRTAVYVGRLAREKGLDVLVKAWKHVVLECHDARLTLVGEGPCRRELERQAIQLGLDGAIELPGASADPTSWLRTADLFVLPSREEGMSIALLEAMALGIPAVVTAIPGNARLITDGVHGRLVPADDPPALARAILETWDHPRQSAVCGFEARQRVIERFSISAVARRHLELFESLVREKVGGKG